MLQTLFSRIGWFVLLILLQVTVFNHVHIMGYATPLPYVYFLLLLRSDTPRWVFILTGFVLGLLVDLFSNTPGMAAASLCAVGLFAPPLMHLIAPVDKDEDAITPSMRTMNRGGFILYALLLTLLHCLLFFTIEAFTLLHWQTLLINIGGSTGLTLLCIIAFELLRAQRN